MYAHCDHNFSIMSFKRLLITRFLITFIYTVLTLCTVTFVHSTYRCRNYLRDETIQGRKLFMEILFTHVFRPYRTHQCGSKSAQPNLNLESNPKFEFRSALNISTDTINCQYTTNIQAVRSSFEGETTLFYNYR